MKSEESRKDLEVYLKDHYAGGVAALELLEHSLNEHKDGPLGPFFADLHADVSADHEQLHNLMLALGFEASSVRNAGAWAAEKFARAKLGFSGADAGGLRLLQALESLLLGITGKRAAWRALDAARDASPILQQTDFAQLESRASEQLARVETKRLETARGIFGKD